MELYTVKQIWEKNNSFVQKRRKFKVRFVSELLNSITLNINKFCKTEKQVIFFYSEQSAGHSAKILGQFQTALYSI